MKKLALFIFLICGISAYSQKVNNQPEEFNRYIKLNDSLKIGGSSVLAQYGLFLKVDTLADGSFVILADTVTSADSLNSLLDVTVSGPSNDNVLRYNGTLWINDALLLQQLGNVGITGEATGNVIRFDGANWINAFLPYANLDGEPFETASNGWKTATDNETFSFGGTNDTTSASVYAKQGIQRGVFQMSANETNIEGSEADVFYVGQNNVPTQINSFSSIQEGRTITLIGWDSPAGANTSEVTSASNIILLGADPAPLGSNQMIVFICVRRNGGTGDLILIEQFRQ